MTHFQSRLNNELLKSEGGIMKNLTIVFHALCVIVIIFGFQGFIGWLCYCFILKTGNNLSSILSQCGQFGDMFGFVNTFFSGLAFVGIVYTIFLQRKDLELQREDLELTRKELKLTTEELKRSAKAQEESEKALKNQADIATKTALLNAANSILKNSLEGLHNLKNEPDSEDKRELNELFLNRINNSNSDIAEIYSELSKEIKQNRISEDF